jgi:Sec7-like guanine-nucleotide exchange factor
VIRELIIRCLSQMVLARVANIKSGWKSMFMVFTTAAGDNDPTIVRLAFDTIEKIVREHFNYITGGCLAFLCLCIVAEHMLIMSFSWLEYVFCWNCFTYRFQAT